MHLSDEQRKEQLKEMVVEKARQILANRDENRAKAAVAQQVWQALLKSPVWTVAPVKKPRDPNWVEPEEIWSQHVEVVKK